MTWIAVQSAPRRIDVPAWAVVVVLIWMALVAAALYFRPPGEELILCHFKRVTGVPCPTCGTTRAGIALSHGNVMDAVALNPLTTTAMVIVSVALLLRCGFGLTVRCPMSDRWRSVWWICAGILIAANWVYLIASGR